MTDRELIEHAAKAAGVDVVWGHFGFGQEWLTPDHILGGLRPWRPLTDDGDALRLAVKLGIRVLFPAIESVSGYHNAACVGTFEHGEVEEYVDDHADMYAATRRAIVRAAAAMPAEQKP